MRAIRTLDLADAETAILAMREALLAEGRVAVLAVVDVGGDLLALVRMDDVPASSVTIARNKAWTAAMQAQATLEVGARLRDPNQAFDISYFGDNRACGWGGGVPVLDDEGVVIGAVAVSGLPETDDDRIARVGVAAVVARLERLE